MEEFSYCVLAKIDYLSFDFDHYFDEKNLYDLNYTAILKAVDTKAAKNYFQTRGTDGWATLYEIKDIDVFDSEEVAKQEFLNRYNKKYKYIIELSKQEYK